MMLGSLVSGSAPCFHDVRTYWSPEACERVTGQKPDGVAANGFIHLINSGATALDGSGGCVDAEGNHVMKPFWEMTDAEDVYKRQLIKRKALHHFNFSRVIAALVQLLFIAIPDSRPCLLYTSIVIL